MYIKQRESEYLLLNCPVGKKKKKRKLQTFFLQTMLQEALISLSQSLILSL